MSREKPVILNKQVVASTGVFEVEALDLRFSNGEQRRFERLNGGLGAVLVVPMLDVETVLLIREYAVGMERYELGLPKGRMEAGEAIIEAANREIMEEVGYGARRLRHLDSLSSNPNYSSQLTHVVLAEDLYPRRLPGDEPEDLEVVPWPLSRLSELLARSDMTEARSIAALFMAREHLA